ncbi:hypothetical protein A5641_10405 [Mycobacterium sp. 1554424.7]|nr:hypothetical protein A5641_10405 [Mycobacterium sp. 1554424.7]
MTFHLTGNSQIHAESAYANSVCNRGDGSGYAGSGGYSLNTQGAIVFFNIERAGSSVAADPDSELRRIEGVIDTTIKIERGRSYPATRSLIDSLQLGSAFVVAETATAVDQICSRVRQTVRSWFFPND